MKLLLNLKIDLISPFKTILDDVVAAMPAVLGFFAFVIISWIFIKVFLWIVRKALSKTNIDNWSEKLAETEIFGDTTVNVVLTKVILGVLKWFLILVFVMAGSSIFGLTAVSDGISSFFAYLPRLLSALLILVVGIYVGTIVKKAIISTFKSLEISGGNVLANIAFYLIVVFLSITAFDQAGINTSIIKSNLTLVIASILASFTIAFGLGARDIVKKLLFGYYSRKNFQIGQTIVVEEEEGTIIAIDNICMTIQAENKRIVLPINKVVNSKVSIKN